MILFCSMLFWNCCPIHDLHSFPTRRSSDLTFCGPPTCIGRLAGLLGMGVPTSGCRSTKGAARDMRLHLPGATVLSAIRSEEHKSELQSHVNLVCRLLLEKIMFCVMRCWNGW